MTYPDSACLTQRSPALGDHLHTLVVAFAAPELLEDGDELGIALTEDLWGMGSARVS